MEIMIKNARYLIIPKNTGLKPCIEPAIADLGLNENIEIIKRRGEDIPYLLSCLYSCKIPALGVTGDDLYDEARYADEL